MKNYIIKWIFIFTAGIICILGITACGNNSIRTDSSLDPGSTEVEIIHNRDGSYSCDFFAMDTVMQLKAYGEDEAQQALADALSEIKRLDEELNVTNKNSPVFALNHHETDTVSGDTARILEQSLRMAELTDGAFDPTIYPIVRAWGFTTQKYRIPDSDEIEELLNHVGYDRIVISEEENGMRIVFNDEQTEIDTGGIGKGYASEVIYRIMKDDGVKSAVVSLGGNVMTIGEKPDGSQWKVAIEDPFNRDNTIYAGVIRLTDKYAITSGGYQRFFENNGKTYIHIMDPSTGVPVDNDLSSVTIISESGTEGDALSTALYVMGLEGALEYWKTTGLNFDMILITTDKEVYVTEDIAGDFSSDNRDYKKIHTVSKE